MIDGKTTLQFEVPHCNVSSSFLPFQRSSLKTTCPLPANEIIICSAARFQAPFGLYARVAYHFSSLPGPRNDQCPFGKFLARTATRDEFSSRTSWLPFLVQSMSFYFDIKMMRSSKFLQLNCSFSINSWTSWSRSRFVRIGEVFHSNTTVSPSMLSSSRY